MADGKKMIEVTPEELAEHEAKQKHKEEAKNIDALRRGDMGVPASIAEEIIAHPKFKELSSVAGFNPQTAPVIAGKVWETIKAETKAAKDKAAADEAAETAKRNAGGGQRQELVGGGGGAIEKPKPNQYDEFMKNEKVDPKIGGPLGRIIKGKQLHTQTT